MFSIMFNCREESSHVYNLFEKAVSEFEERGLNIGSVTKKESTLFWSYNGTKEEWEHGILPYISAVLTKHVVDTKESEWLLTNIQDVFLYNDVEVAAEILEMAFSVLDGKKAEMPVYSHFYHRECFIYQPLLEDLRKNKQLQWEPFLTFRIGKYFSCLLHALECAIDEYKWEQEYQTMVESFRDFVNRTVPAVPVVHLVYGEKVRFFDENYNEITTQMRMRCLVKDLVFEKELLPEEMVISPLVSMAPELLHIYSNSDEHGVIKTLQAVFQERVKVYPLHFMSSLNLKQIQ
ncbi:sporulation protein YtxC [Thalassorhabdus alkalitolerans]|uniref:Sporulation protein YtxC n=1 Tax=Thalassorhabdus alkalitolerans TaxID=2282697 RepID=A0ABW0YQC9_9BACI